MNKNDARIMNLRKDIQERKETLSSAPVKFNPKTNCILRFNGKSNNLHTCDEETLINLAIDLNCRLISAANLPSPFVPETDPEKIMVCGYSIKDWMSDIYDMIQSFKYDSSIKKLERLERELETLLSADVKTEIRLDEIETLLTK